MKRSTAVILLCVAAMVIGGLNQLLGGSLMVVQLLPLGGLALLLGLPGALVGAVFVGVTQTLALAGVLHAAPTWQPATVVIACLLMGTHQAVTERRRAHARMQQRLIEGLRDGVLFADDSLALGLANPAAVRLLRLPAGTRGRAGRLTELGITALWQACRATGHAADPVELQLDGRVVRIVVAPVVEDGSVVGIVTTVSDITEERRAAQLRDDFLGFISHEIRNPLASITGYAEVLLTYPLPDGLDGYTRIIKRNADRLLRLVRDLLQLNTLEAGAFRLDPVVVDVGTVLRDVADDQQAAADAAGVALALEVEGPPAVGECDGSRLAQVFGNLLDNAIRYANTGSTVRVRLTVTDGQALIEVNNRGPVIPAEALETIFEKHRRLPHVGPGSREGAGLGLPICRHLVDLHGGRIWATSDPEAGTSFWVALPIEDPALVLAG